jgi:hypothetical protein
MKQTFDTDNYLYGVLKASTSLVTLITGGIYVMGERPDNSELEDIVINTITLTQDSTPQRGVSNVNIHVADIDVTVRGTKQKKANRKRMQDLTTAVLAVLTAAKITGLNYWVTNQSTIKEVDVSQHFVNLRIEWSIYL